LKNLVSEAEISEIHAIVSIMNMNNAMFSFKNKLNNPVYSNYPIGLNMSSFAKTILDKPNFELIALIISNLNQCKPCTVHHEQKCIDLQISSEQVYKAIQLSSFVKSLCVFNYLDHP
jgi:AhpD family alkylhydroperoxidase